jgi:hypothetical protein
MPVVIPWLRSARRLLAERIEQLHRTLVTMTDRVRQTIAEAVGKAVSGVVQETVRAVLDQLHGPLPARRQLEYEPRSRRFNDSGGLFPGGVPPDDFAEDERPYDPFSDERFPATPYQETAFDEDRLPDRSGNKVAELSAPVRRSRWRRWSAIPPWQSGRGPCKTPAIILVSPQAVREGGSADETGRG